ncbi:hypothetical protein BRYFOR_08277 [Marvinbryantia formatexigens DSM 14469]|uniref:Uncharacterized protein n=1 Tax=Marvinbryantia formatexigens DSM 14469 TaxID=478749 RepID=C6LI06_9FIRM|nr:PD-(D/E)XK nuclease domain-containing protein [Marvinbryantia formatexigens]EET59661.1 hypothetical protein BRYFOR_08277 [Marvinbryantia formatexigens DSM 14469]
MAANFFDIRKDSRQIFEGVKDNQTACPLSEMGKLLRRTISYHDYKEDFYHAFLAGIFTGAGYMVESNREHGEGRSDVVIHDSVNGKVAVFEIKYSKSMSSFIILFLVQTLQRSVTSHTPPFLLSRSIPFSCIMSSGK